MIRLGERCCMLHWMPNKWMLFESYYNGWFTPGLRLPPSTIDNSLVSCMHSQMVWYWYSGASLHAFDQKGRGALSIAIKGQMKDFVFMLLDQGLTVESKNDQLSLLEWALTANDNWVLLKQFFERRLISTDPIPPLPVCNHNAQISSQ
jgi:hypothetical protein